MTSKQLALTARSAAGDKKAESPVILDIRKQTNIAHFFVLVHGNSDRHVRAIADSVVEKLKEKKEKPLHVEGIREGAWILIDYGSVMVHVFHKERRKFYNLERLWGDAKLVMEKKNERKSKAAR